MSKNTCFSFDHFDVLVASRAVFPSSCKQLLEITRSIQHLPYVSVVAFGNPKRTKEDAASLEMRKFQILLRDINSDKFGVIAGSFFPSTRVLRPVMTIVRYFRLYVQFSTTCLTSPWLQEFYKSRVSPSQRLDCYIFVRYAIENYFLYCEPSMVHNRKKFH